MWAEGKQTPSGAKWKALDIGHNPQSHCTLGRLPHTEAPLPASRSRLFPPLLEGGDIGHGAHFIGGREDWMSYLL